MRAILPDPKNKRTRQNLYRVRMKGKVTGQGDSGSNAEMALDVLEDAVAETTCALNIAGLEREAQALSRGVRLVHRYVAPPHAAVVPQVVVKVIVVDTKRDLGLLRGHFRKLSVKVKAEFQTQQMVSAFVSEPPCGTSGSGDLLSRRRG